MLRRGGHIERDTGRLAACPVADFSVPSSLGTCWCGVYPRRTRVEAVSKALGLPQGIVPLNLVALGYGDEDPPVKDKWRPDRIHWETW